jgi:cell division protein FtsB
MIVLIIVLVVFLLILIYGSIFIKRLIEEIDVKEQLIFNLKKSLQEEQDKSMYLSRSVQLLNESKRSKMLNSN